MNNQQYPLGGGNNIRRYPLPHQPSGFYINEQAPNGYINQMPPGFADSPGYPYNRYEPSINNANQYVDGNYNEYHFYPGFDPRERDPRVAYSNPNDFFNERNGNNPQLGFPEYSSPYSGERNFNENDPLRNQSIDSRDRETNPTESQFNRGDLTYHPPAPEIPPSPSNESQVSQDQQNLPNESREPQSQQDQNESDLYANRKALNNESKEDRDPITYLPLNEPNDGRELSIDYDRNWQSDLPQPNGAISNLNPGKGGNENISYPQGEVEQVNLPEPAIPNENIANESENSPVELSSDSQYWDNEYYDDDCDDYCGSCYYVPNPWNIWVYPNYFYVGYTGGRGIGYHHGYGTIGAFLSPPIFRESRFRPFVDVEGYCFTNGRWAASAGIGSRYLLPNSNLVVGANIFYDYRDFHRFNLHQIGVGLELLGPCVDFRCNAYIPVGRHHINHVRLFEFSYDDFMAIRHRRVSAWTGFDAEVGTWIKRRYACDWFGLYFAIGPYYYYRDRDHHRHLFEFEKHRHDAVGGRARLLARIWDFVDISVIATYDPVWKARVQGQITIAIPFDYCKNFFQNPLDASRCCCAPCLQEQIAIQPVYRNGIIVADQECSWLWNWSDECSCQSSTCSQRNGCSCQSSSHSSEEPSCRSISLSDVSSYWSSVCPSSYSHESSTNRYDGRSSGSSGGRCCD